MLEGVFYERLQLPGDYEGGFVGYFPQDAEKFLIA